MALFGPTDPARNGPYSKVCNTGDANPGKDTDPCEGDIVLREPNSITSHSRNDKTDPSMLAIQIDSVFKAVCRRIGARS